MQNYVITITRQFGSRGRDIGIATAKKLGIPLYDRNVLEKEAEEIDSTLHSLVEFSKNGMSSSGYYKMAYPLGIGSSLKKDRMFEVQSKLVLQHAETENCVIIGRCADYALADFPHVVTVFITGDDDVRIRTLMDRHQISESKAKETMIKTDKRRASYYNYYSNKRWGDIKSYDLCINSSKVGIDGAVKLIREFADLKMAYRRENL